MTNEIKFSIIYFQELVPCFNLAVDLGGAGQVLPIAGIPLSLNDFAEQFSDVFNHPAQDEHFKEVLVGLLVAENRTVAGILNLTHTELSSKILNRKVAFLKDTGASVVVITNPGCMLQLGFGVRQAGLNMQVCHISEILDRIYSNENA